MKRLMLVAALFCSLGAARAAEPLTWKLDFGSGTAAAGTLKVTPDMVFNAERGYGFEPGPALTAIERTVPTAAHRDFITSAKPFAFSVAVPEGNYAVTAILGDPAGESVTTIKAEARRLMVENAQTTNGQFAMPAFTVNVRRPQISTGGAVSLHQREQGAPTWDNKLTLEFSGVNPCVCGLKITKVEDAVTVFIAGDSTVTDGANEPYTGWGQMLPRFFKSNVAVANHAESGRALFSFRGENRLAKILSQIKPGDYFFIQFGHNDQKDKTPGSGPFTSYKTNLKSYVAQARAKGALPVIVTPMERRRFDANGKQFETLTDFAQAARDAAKETSTPLIDLHAMSLKFYAALGPETSKKAFVHYPPGTFPGQDKEVKDDTHFNNYGGYELAKCVVEGIRANVPELGKLLGETAPFDPSKPDAFEAVNIPASAVKPVAKPAGD